MIRPPCEVTDQLAVGTQNCFSTLFYTPYTNIKTSAQNARKCTIAGQQIKKNILTLPPLGRGYPLPRPHPLGASIGVPVPFHLRFEHWVLHWAKTVQTDHVTLQP